MAFAAALSRHPVTAHAVGEVCGQVLEGVGPGAGAAVLFVTGGHAGALEDAAAVVRSVLNPAALIGCAAQGVLANGEEVEEGPGIALWAGDVGRARAAHLQVHPTGPDDAVVTGWPDAVGFSPSAAVLLADPFSLPTDALLESVAEDGSMPIVGGHASAAVGPGGNRLLIDDQVVTAGAALLLLSEDVHVEAVLSNGGRPVGQPLTVTDADGARVIDLGGQRALSRIAELAEQELSQAEISAVNRGGLHLGRVVDTSKLDPAPGDFVVHTLLGGNQEEGWIALDRPVAVGDVVQFHLRDADGADQDLRAALRDRHADAALAFTCNGRGEGLFGAPDHDAEVIADLLGQPPVAGMFAAGEIGPLEGRNALHGFSASMLLLRGR